MRRTPISPPIVRNEAFSQQTRRLDDELFSVGTRRLDDDLLTCYCSRCGLRTPYTYATESRGAGAIFLDTPGPLHVGRIVPCNTEITVCAKCGSRGFTRADG